MYVYAVCICIALSIVLVLLRVEGYTLAPSSFEVAPAVAPVEIPGSSCKAASQTACAESRGRARDRCLSAKRSTCTATRDILETLRDDHSENIIAAARALRRCNKDAQKNKGMFSPCRNTAGSTRKRCITPLRKECFTKSYTPVMQSKNKPMSDLLFKPIILAASGLYSS